MTIHRLLYRSDCALAGTTASVHQQIGEIVRASESRNAARDLTGALLYTRGVFIQALEGPLPAVEDTFERICCDLRHSRVDLLELVEAPDRVFGVWSMARVMGDPSVERLFEFAAPDDHTDFSAASAQATIRLMHAMLIGRPGPSVDASPRKFEIKR